MSGCSPRGSQAAWVVGSSFSSAPLRAPSFPVPDLEHVQGCFRSPVARFPVPLRALPSSPARLVSSWRHPWDFSLQRSDFVLSRSTSRLAMPFFSLAGHVAVLRIRDRSLAATGRATASTSSFETKRPAVPGLRTRVTLDARTEVSPARAGKTGLGGPYTAASRAAGSPRLPWAVADFPKVVACRAPYDGGRACVRGRSLAASLRSAASHRVSRSPHGVRWPVAFLLPRSSSARRVTTSPQAGSCWNSRVSAQIDARRVGAVFTPLAAVAHLSWVSRPPGFDSAFLLRISP